MGSGEHQLTLTAAEERCPETKELIFEAVTGPPLASDDQRRALA
jgi:hypothetical protein